MDEALHDIDEKAVGLKLCYFDKDDCLHFFEAVYFERGAIGIQCTLNQASVCGDITLITGSGPLPDYFTEVIDKEGDCLFEIELDHGVFKQLKYKLRPVRDYCGLSREDYQKTETGKLQ